MRILTRAAAAPVATGRATGARGAAGGARARQGQPRGEERPIARPTDQAAAVR